MKSRRSSSNRSGSEWFLAGIPEYWVVDARGEEMEFQIYKHGANRYSATRKQDGWLKSALFGKSFRLIRGEGCHGQLGVHVASEITQHRACNWPVYLTGNLRLIR
jgi:hypothetical protein